MKRILITLGVAVVYLIASVILDSVLGIKFPSIGAGVIHDLLAMIYGGVLLMIAYAKI